MKANVGSVSDPKYKIWLSNWTNPFQAQQSGFLVREGADELYGIGQRFAMQAGSLIGRNGFDPIDTTFQNTQTERTAVSAQSFAAGLFREASGVLPNGASPIYSFNLPEKQDPTLRPFDTCPEFELASALTPNEAEKWMQLQAPPRLSRLSHIFGATVDLSLYQTMYSACAFEYAALNVSEHFCSLLQEIDFRINEYYEDLNIYYRESYGLPIAVQIGAPLLQEFVRTFKSKFQSLLASGAPTPAPATTFFRFAHAETAEPILAILGLYNDSMPLKADWSWEKIDARAFRSSQIFPFATNLYIHGYDCGTNSRSSPERFLLRIQHNERDIDVPGCASQSAIAPFCGFDLFQNIYDNALAINFTRICNVRTPTPPTVPPPKTVAPSAPLPKFLAIYLWGPVVIVATFAIAFVSGFCVGSHRPIARRSEPLLSAGEHHYR